MRILKWLMITLLALIVIIAVGAAVIGWSLSTPTTPEGLKRIAASPQSKDGKFVNVEPQADTEITVSALKQAVERHPRTRPEGEIPIVPFNASDLDQPAKQGLRLTWLGHAAVLIEIDGKRILTDPALSERVSPFSFAGPMRFHAPPIPLKDLRGIDAVVITHNHYDHLDRDSIRHLAGKGTEFYVPLGNKALLVKWGVAEGKVKEMDWWDEAQLGDVKIVATPSRHYSNRGLFDFKETLWASWSIIGPQNRVFVSGDTGYSKLFTEVGEKLGPFDATIIKVGAYGPGQSWIDVHMTPENAIKVHKDLRGKAMLPVHWATFNLAYHPWDEPIIRTVAAAKTEGVALFTPKVGETIGPALEQKSKAWWEGVD